MDKYNVKEFYDKAVIESSSLKSNWWLYLLIIVIIVSVALSIYFSTRPSNKESYRNYPADELSQVIGSNGRAMKILKDNRYHYNFSFNLPITNPPFQIIDVGKNFNSVYDRSKYIVYLGKSKKEMKPVGNLERHSDGFHKFYLVSDKKYRYYCITINDDVVACDKL